MLFSGKKEENINLSSPELAKIVVKVNQSTCMGNRLLDFVEDPADDSFPFWLKVWDYGARHTL